mgnify:CR=1 FL=1
MNVFSKILTAISAVIAIIGLIFIFAFFLLKLLWAWTIPELFPGAVEAAFGTNLDKPLIAPEISWGTAAKLAIFLSFLGGFMKIKSNKSK